MLCSNWRARKKQSLPRSSSCSFTPIICQAGKGRARYVASPDRRPRVPATAEAVTAPDVHRAIIAAWRIEQPRLIASLARMLRDVTLAEELTQDALVAAL